MLPALFVLLLGAPETDAAKLLRIAYASQYEWKEDGLKNVTLEFTYTWTWRPKARPKDKKPPPPTADLEGSGRIVVVGDRVVPGHYPDLSRKLRGEFGKHLGWVLQRFVRRPFDVAFKDAEFKGPEETAFGLKIVAHGLPLYAHGLRLYVKQDRIAAMEKDVSLPKQKKPHMVLVQFEHGKVGDGYAILRETCNYTARGTEKAVSWTRKLTTKETERAPVPLSYTYTRTVDKTEETLEIEFDRVTVDSEHPVVLDPVARDLLKGAWERRFTLPDMGIEGEFHRRPDKDLDMAGWSDVPGSFEVWGMNEIKVTIPENRIRDRKWREGVEKRCTDNIRWIFGLLKATPFEEEFKDCGFEMVPQGKEQVVQVYGYENALAFKLAGGAIAGHYSEVLGRKGWWDYRVKRTSDGHFMLDRMKREFEERKIELRFRYGRVKGFQLPKRMDVLGTTFRKPYVGVAEYSFRRLKVLLPEKKG
ncbi:MAG: hypothetical protein ACYS0K_11770 [Planctomycetota bacterium]|jgi:hypothetical protein